MKYNVRVFNKKHIIRIHKPLEFHAIDDLYDIIPGIDLEKPSEARILESWESYFKSIGTPYAITRARGRNGLATLWKERRA